jgi:hypothetical protein
MNNDELEKTKPIQTLKDINTDESNGSRASKYKDVLDEERRKLDEEAAEEALAEKNIAQAEAILAAEGNKDGEGVVVDEAVEGDSLKKKDNKAGASEDDEELFPKLKEKWKSMSKKQKITTIVIAVLVFIVIILLIVLLLSKVMKKDDVKQDQAAEEAVPVIVDNFYYKDGKLYFLDEEDKEIGSYECTNKDEKLCYVAVNNYYDKFDVARHVNADGTVKEQRMPIFDNDYVFVYDNKKEGEKNIGLYSIKNEKVVENYGSVKAYNGGYVIIEDKANKFGLLQIENDTVTQVIAPEYSYLGMIDDEDNLIALNTKGYYVVSKKNKLLNKALTSSLEVKNYNNNYVVVKEGSSYALYDYKGKKLVSGYDFISLIDNYAVLVNGKKAFVIDSSKNKYNEEGIALNNNDYVTTFVYDDKGENTEIKRSYSTIKKDNNIEFTIYNGTEDPTYTQLSLVEGSINKSIAFASYFNGKWYFYDDEDKENLLGYYECSNQNEVNSTKDGYKTCKVAKDTICDDNDSTSAAEKNRSSVIPIINKQYVFMSDGNNNVALFDLKNKQTLGTYQTVNTYSAPGEDITHYSGKVNITVFNKKGKYGVIAIDGSNVSKKVAIDYNKLEKLGSYYIGLNTNSKWVLIDNSSNPTEFNGKIEGFTSNLKYYKILINKQYFVFDDKAQQVANVGYAYVDIYDNFYAGVDSGRNVVVYDYEGNAITQPVKVGNYPFTGSTPAFKIRYNGSYYASIYNGSSYVDKKLELVPKEEPKQPEQPEQTEQ